jgi:hypothetical protein
MMYKFAEKNPDRSISTSDSPAEPDPRQPDGEEAGAASFPASDPPACWTWELEGDRS